MKVMTYNIYDGAAKTLENVIDIVNAEAPDFLSLNEANGFDLHYNLLLKEFAHKTGFKYYHLEKCGDGDDYHVAVFSKIPYRLQMAVHPVSRAAIVTVLSTQLGEIVICGTHLSPHSEDVRIRELRLILHALSPYEHKIILGDLNSLSQKDSYPDSIVENFTHGQLRKFTTNNKIRYELINSLADDGFNDVAALFESRSTNTVPTPVNTDTSHSKMRLDYIMVSDSLKSLLREYAVIKNDLSDISSDHYPVVAVLDI
jgi:exodeoxyribonuclease-3